MTSQREKKNERIALLTSIGVHGGLLLLLLFIVAWRAPNPPLPEYGIELNFGLADQGTGDVQPQAPVGTDQSDEENELQPSPEEPSATEETDELKEEKPEETKPVEPEVTSKTESPVVVKEKKEEVKPTVPKDNPAEKTTEATVESKAKEDPKALYQPNKKSNTEGRATEKEGQPESQGDSKNKPGDKGDPKGSVDAKALYGKQGGGGGGPSLDLSGWAWDEIPNPDVADNESGRIVFEIKVDGSGDIISVRTLETAVSPDAERICRSAIQKLTFTKTGANVPDVSTGKITFVIRSK